MSEVINLAPIDHQDDWMVPRRTPTRRQETSATGPQVSKLFPIKILLFDLVLSIGDVGSDFAQGISLLREDRLRFYGWVTIIINWAPGLVAAIHCISNHRKEFGPAKTLMWAAILLIFYPVIPSIAYFGLLWVWPGEEEENESATDDARKLKRLSSIKLKRSSTMKRLRRLSIMAEKQSSTDNQQANRSTSFKDWSFWAGFSHCIAASIEAPLQFVLQLWLIFTGKVELPWSEKTSLSISDNIGNEITLPFTSVFSMVFSLISMLMAVNRLNIMKIHFNEEDNSNKLIQILGHIVNHSAFFASSMIFRLCSFALFLTYFGELFGMIPIIALWLANVIIGYRKFDLKTIPVWLTSFQAIFFPLYCALKDINAADRERLIRAQYDTFRFQTIICSFLYFPSLIAISVLVNLGMIKYPKSVIFINYDFNVMISIVIATGILSLVLSFKPNLNQTLARKNEIAGAIIGILLTLFILSPLIVGGVLMAQPRDLCPGPVFMDVSIALFSSYEIWDTCMFALIPGDCILIVGGMYNNGESAIETEILDLKTGISKTLGTLLVFWGTGALVKNIPVVCGGMIHGNKFSDECFMFSTRNEWILLSRMTNKRTEASSVVLKSKLWVTGGYHQGGLYETDIIFPNGTVKVGPDLPYIRWGHATVQVKEQVFVIGGNSGARSTLIYNAVDLSTWKHGPLLNYGRHYHGVTSVKSCNHNGAEVIIVAGGEKTPRSVELLDVSQAEPSWEIIEDLPEEMHSRPGLHADPHGGVFIVYNDNIFRLDIKHGAYTYHKLKAKLQRPRFAFVSMKIPGRVNQTGE